MAKVVIFTGAGISAESGIDTFRDSGGVWENFNIEDVCVKGCLEKNRDATINFYDTRRVALKDKQPNYAHKQIVNIQKKYPEKIKLITQNVDDLFEKAGAVDVIHVHGFLTQIRCTNCEYTEEIGNVAQSEAWDSCPMCQSMLRPDIVFFNESAPFYEDMFREMDDCEMLIVMGTSGATLCVGLMVDRGVKYTILNNLEEHYSIDHSKFDKTIFKPATKAVDEIVEDIEQFLSKESR
ncbi:MAG: Sir2 family NAD-dependent protein deacetylase [Campylobacterota bacterium]|nr:Sir2 family NAD-dependent protein deacetylase [Campylobacterota bacterium]